MGGWCSKENQAHKGLSKLFPCLRVASNDESPSPNGSQRSAPGASFISPSGQKPRELSVPGEQQRQPGPQRLQRSPARTDTASTRQAPQRASQRTAEARSSHSLERLPGAATPSVQDGEGVLGELEKLRSSVMDFVDRCFSQSNECLRSKARWTIYRLVLENAETHKNSQSREEIADAVEDQFKKLDCESFSSPNRQRSDLLLICERKTRIREELNRDPGFWKFTWGRGDKSLEFPAAERDEVPLYQGLPFEADSEGITDDEQG